MKVRLLGGAITELLVQSTRLGVVPGEPEEMGLSHADLLLLDRWYRSSRPQRLDVVNLGVKGLNGVV